MCALQIKFILSKLNNMMSNILISDWFTFFDVMPSKKVYSVKSQAFVTFSVE